MGTVHHAVPAVCTFLEEKGYRVSERVSVEELEFIEAFYDLVAEKEGERTLVAVTYAKHDLLLTELAKALNVKDKVVILAQGSLPTQYKELTRGRVKVVSFENVDELEEKLRQAFL
ncbi:MAG: hypothetical protein QXO02_09565 [Thermofilaceae archaeon]